jgi:hypothetical protein
MAFDDLDEAIEEQDHEDDGDDAGEEPTEVDGAADQAASEDIDKQEDSTNESAPLTEPAFEVSETEQDALYARPATWDIFDDMLDLDLERELRERDIRDVPQSEKYDAVLRFAAEHPEAIADLIEAERVE